MEALAKARKSVAPDAVAGSNAKGHVCSLLSLAQRLHETLGPELFGFIPMYSIVVHVLDGEMDICAGLHSVPEDGRIFASVTNSKRAWGVDPQSLLKASLQEMLMSATIT
jgi:hypothetical protein